MGPSARTGMPSLRSTDAGWFRRYVWPSAGVGVVNVAYLLASVVALILAILDIVGLVSVSNDRFVQLIAAIAAIVLVGFVTEGAERREQAGQQRDVLAVVERFTTDAAVREVPANQIGTGISVLLSDSSEWLFRGGSGRYLRSHTLPTMGEIRDREVEIRVQVLDPRDSQLCQGYADYRNLQRGELVRRADEGDMRNIQADLLASIYAAGWYDANTRIEARVTLLRTISPLRFDMGSVGLYVTVADPVAPALYASSESWYYKSIRDEITHADHGHPHLSFPGERGLFPARREDVVGNVVSEGLAGMRVEDPLGRGDTLLSEAASAELLDFDDIAQRVFHSDEH
jgi:hypothetical protein